MSSLLKHLPGSPQEDPLSSSPFCTYKHLHPSLDSVCSPRSAHSTVGLPSKMCHLYCFTRSFVFGYTVPHFFNGPRGSPKLRGPFKAHTTNFSLMPLPPRLVFLLPSLTSSLVHPHTPRACGASSSASWGAQPQSSLSGPPRGPPLTVAPSRAALPVQGLELGLGATGQLCARQHGRPGGTRRAPRSGAGASRLDGAPTRQSQPATGDGAGGDAHREPPLTTPQAPVLPPKCNCNVTVVLGNRRRGLGDEPPAPLAHAGQVPRKPWPLPGWVHSRGVRGAGRAGLRGNRKHVTGSGL